jgi:hypothetical protein
VNPVTLSDLAHDGKLLWVYCTDCGRERDLDPASLPLPGETPVPSVGKRMKCSACGSRTIDPSSIRAASWPCASGRGGEP